MFELGSDIYFKICRPIKKHARQIMAWRNNPTTLSMSFHQAPKIWQPFWHEFCTTYFECDKKIYPVFAMLEKKPVGFLKFTPINHPSGLDRLTIDLSINIAPHVRGQGIGIKALKACVNYLANQGVSSISADILSYNIISIKAFTHAGFMFIEEREKLIIDINKKYKIHHFCFNIS